MYITRQMLEGAPHEQLVAFTDEWPDGAGINHASLLRAVELGLDWLADNLLSLEEWATYQIVKNVTKPP
jgi:hypothetical protein